MGLQQCEDCAFKRGGAANKEKYNKLRAEVCALGAVPFFCHHEVDWENRNWTPAQEKQNCRIAGSCAGWRMRVRELKAKGWFNEFRSIRQAFAKIWLRLIDEWTEQKDPQKKRRTLLQMKSILKFLATKDIADKELPL